MQNYISKGASILFLATVAIVAGALVKIGDLVGVASGSAQVGEETTVSLQGVYEVPKAAVAIGVGVKVYLDDVTGKVTTDATGGKALAGYAFNAAIAGDATVKIKLVG